MKGVIWGLAIGCAIGYIMRKLQDEGQFECVSEYADKCFAKSKSELKDVVDAAKSKAEKLKEQLKNVTAKQE